AAGEAFAAAQAEPFRVVAGTILRDLEMLRAAQHLALDRAAPNPHGVWLPYVQPLDAAKLFFMESYPRAVAELRRLLGSELFHLFTEETLDAVVERALCAQWGITPDARRRRAALTLVFHDLLLGDFGLRHELYEALNTGNPRALTGYFWDRNQAAV